jgi:hypothetical protein
VRPGKHGLDKRFKVRSAEFDDWANVVGKQVATNVNQTGASINAAGKAAVSFKFCDDPDVLAELERSGTPTAV